MKGAKAAMMGELKALKAHNAQLAVLLARKAEPPAVKAAGKRFGHLSALNENSKLL